MSDHKILPRLAEIALREALNVQPVVVLMGARQTGNSTLVESLPGKHPREHLSLDDLQVRGQARTAPDVLAHRASVMSIDEVQREPSLILSIKRAVDAQRPRQRGQFLLAGSANLLLMRRISESRAGRATYIPLWPLTRRERLGLVTPGLWRRFLEYRGYVQTYLERDLQDLSTIDNLVDFQRMMRATCLRLGTILNSAEI